MACLIPLDMGPDPVHSGCGLLAVLFKGYTADEQSIRGFPFFYPEHLRRLIFILLRALFILPPGDYTGNMGRSTAGTHSFWHGRLSRWVTCWHCIQWVWLSP